MHCRIIALTSSTTDDDEVADTAVEVEGDVAVNECVCARKEICCC